VIIGRVNDMASNTHRINDMTCTMTRLCRATVLDGYCSTVVDGYCSTVQGLLDWFEVDSGFTELLFNQIDLCRATDS